MSLFSASGASGFMALRSKGIPEAYIEIIRDMYHDSASMVRTAVSETKSS